MQLDTRWTQAEGVCPARLRFSPIGSRVFPADRTLRITIRPQSWGGPFQSVTQLNQTIQIPEGDDEASTTIYLPVESQTYALSMEVRENGRLLPDLQADGAPLNAYGWSSGLMSFLIIDKDVSSIYARQWLPRVPGVSDVSSDDSGLAPDLRKMISLLGQPQNYNGMSLSTKLSGFELSKWTTNIEYLPPRDLPANIVGLASIDLIMIDFDELRELAERHPERFEALRNWLILGGNLCVSRAGESFQNVAAIEQALRIASASVPREWLSPQEALLRVAPRLAASGSQSDNPLSMLSADEINDLVGPTSYRDEWCFPLRDDYAVSSTNVENFRANYGMKEAKLDLEALPDSPTFAVRRAHLGTVVAFRGDFSEVSRESWNWFINSFPRSCCLWESRFGLSLSSANDGYWDFLIPDVGLPPVMAFHVLLTLFVVAIGPLNYFFLQRYRQLNWLMATVPLGASITIVGLIAFALLTDGLAARGRVRSLTHIDQRTGDVATWSRQSYYAGVAPSSGLSFPQDALVFPIEYTSASNRSVFTGSRRVQEWDGDQVHYKMGYFPSRTTVQFAVARAGRTERGIRLVSVNSADEKAHQAAVTNQLGAAVRLIIVRAHDASLYAAEDLDAGQTGALKSIDESGLLRRMREVFAGHALSPPPGFDRSLMQNGMLIRQYGQRGVSNRDGILEHALTRLSAGHGVIDQPDSYVAIVDRSAHTPLGLKSFIESNSLYVVTGRVPPFEP